MTISVLNLLLCRKCARNGFRPGFAVTMFSLACVYALMELLGVRILKRGVRLRRCVQGDMTYEITGVW